jgi:uncharacterized protein (TIGR00290 family)
LLLLHRRSPDFQRIRMEPILLAWSGGKDSMLLLHELQREAAYRVAALVTTVDEATDRVSGHGVPRTLIEEQARALGLPVEIVGLPPHPSNALYREAWGQVLARFRGAGIKAIAYGDLLLADVREFRETLSAKLGMRASFPLWDRDTGLLAWEFLRLGHRATIASVDTERLPADLAGREYDDAFLQALPPSADPAGEHGEFHTFVYDGPLFRRPVGFERGEVFLQHGRFAVCDLRPRAETRAAK